MIKRSALFALAFICLPMFANANVISLEYTGHVTTLFGNGSDIGISNSNGYSVGDTVSGKLGVDFSKATYVDLIGQDTARYQASVSNGLVVGAVDTNAEGWNIVDVYNNSRSNGVDENRDYFQVRESRPSTTLPDWVNTFQLTLDLNGFDWLTDLTLNNVNIITSDANTLFSSFGAFNQSLSGVDANGSSYFYYNTTIFALDSIKLVSTEVPEPSSIALLFVGGLALFLRRKRA